MPRKLPWEINPPVNNVPTSPSKKRKRDAPDSSLASRPGNSDENESKTLLSSQEKERSPSPELLPPPSPLRAGTDGDDIYIVVEDELFLTARKFAAPLHASAYRKWQTEKASRAPDWKPEGIGAVTSSGSIKGKEEDNIREVQQKSVDDILKQAQQRKRVAPVEGADNWGKGVLADLLRGKSKRLHEEVSLVGLDGVRSRTKSAILAERAQRKGRSNWSYKNRSRPKDDDDLENNSTADDYDGTTTDDDDDDDDLDISVKKESQYNMSFGTQRSDERAVRFAPEPRRGEVQQDVVVKLEKSSQDLSTASTQRPFEDLDFDFPAPRALKTRTSRLK